MKQTIEAINGLVRPVVTFGFAAGMLIGFITGQIAADAFIGTAAMVIGFWFRDRQEEKKTGSD